MSLGDRPSDRGDEAGGPAGLRAVMHDIGTPINARKPCGAFAQDALRYPSACAAAIVDGAMAYTIRSARTRDVPVIRKLLDSNVESGRLLSKATVTLYEDIQEFCVAELREDAALAGCGALHVMWEDLAEIRTVAVHEDCRGLGIGHGIVDTLLQRARVLGVERVFVLTFAVDFFARHGFQLISGTPVAAEVYSELLRSYDEGVAEFLDLERVKPNTLGNTRMLLRLLPDR
jgi:amino-acid N-acetyltransferase